MKIETRRMRRELSTQCWILQNIAGLYERLYGADDGFLDTNAQDRAIKYVLHVAQERTIECTMQVMDFRYQCTGLSWTTSGTVPTKSWTHTNESSRTSDEPTSWTTSQTVPTKLNHEPDSPNHELDSHELVFFHE
jgi:hypothetical protein